MTDEALGDRLDGLEAKLDRLVELVEGLRSSTAAGGADPGSPLGGGDEVWQRLGLTEGERRIVTVLFADVSGFTALSEQLDPEAFQLVMRDTMTLLADCVTEEGGTLEKFIGDALCALFGAPVAHPDEPERAARAALAMHEALARRAKDRPDLPELEVHVGINTGPVIAGAVGDGSQFGVMGDTINSAARLMNIAVHRETIVSAETARRLRHGFRLEDRGVHEVKGKSKPIATFALLGELAPEERVATASRLEAPLVGRDREMAQLRALAAGAAAGDGRAVVLLGEDGAGSSRLAAEVAKELGASGWRVLQASARVHAETPLGLVATALGPLLADGAGQLAGGTQGPLASALLADASAAPHDFELMLGEVVVAAAQETPLLVALDDADQADPGSIEVFRYLARSTADDRVLWVLAANEVPPPFEVLVGSPDLVVLEIPPLRDADLRDLFEGVFPGALTPEARDRLAHLADGNVQYAIEIALALIDEGLLVETETGWRAVGDVATCELPGSVAELVEARIDQLSTAARLVLQDAAVIGQRFGRQLLERVATVPGAVEAALAELVESDLVVPGGGGEPGLWSFRSRLVREVAYESILKRRRPAAHRAVADALLQLEPDRVRDNAELLAHHFEEGDDPPLALAHLLVAVNRAERAYNLTGAVDRARRALRLRDRFPGRVPDADAAWLLQRLGINRLLLGDRSGHDDLEEAVALLGATGAPAATVAGLEERVGWYLAVDGEREAATRHLQRAQAIAEGDLDGEARTGILAGVATTRAFVAGAMGDLVVGLAAVDGAEHEAAVAGDRFVEARAKLVGGVLRYWSGLATEAADHLRSALDLAWQETYATIADRCGRWLVAALVDAGRGDEALALGRPILARADDRGDPTVACGVRAALAQHWRLAGDHDRAVRRAEEAESILTGRWVAPDAAADSRLVLAQLALDPVLGAPPDPDALGVATHEAERHLRALEAVLEVDPWLGWRSRARIALLRARVALLHDDAEGAADLAGDARAAVARAAARRELVGADLLEGEARTRLGEPAGPELLHRAAAGAEALGIPALLEATREALRRSTVPAR